jgi:hypothetical protein
MRQLFVTTWREGMTESQPTLEELLKLNGWFAQLMLWRKNASSGLRRQFRHLHATQSAKLADEISAALNQVLANPPEKLFESLRLQNEEGFRFIWQATAGNIVRDKFRDPQYRAIRESVAALHKNGLLWYRPGSLIGGRHSCYAAGPNGGLPMFQGPALSEDAAFGAWNAPIIPETGKRNDFVYAFAESLWAQATEKIPPPAYLPLRELQIFINSKISADKLTLYLPLREQLPQDVQLDTFALPSEDDPRGQSLEVEIERSDPFSYANDCVATLKTMLSPIQMRIFCLRTAELTLAETAKQVGLNSPQLVRHHYNKALAAVREFCSRQHGLADADADKTIRETFGRELHKYCEDVAAHTGQKGI